MSFSSPARRRKKASKGRVAAASPAQNDFPSARERPRGGELAGMVHSPAAGEASAIISASSIRSGGGGGGNGGNRGGGGGGSGGGGGRGGCGPAAEETTGGAIRSLESSPDCVGPKSSPCGNPYAWLSGGANPFLNWSSYSAFLAGSSRQALAASNSLRICCDISACNSA